MALKKSQLYSSLWESCNEFRGGMDASQYKDHGLSLLFMKYVSDKNAGRPNALIEVPQGGGFAFLEQAMIRRFDGGVELIQTDGGSEFKEAFAKRVLAYC